MATVEVFPVEEHKLPCICAWCGKVLSRPSDSQTPETDISHGICRECHERVVGSFREEAGKLRR